jgi:hypothetical protein
MPETPLNPKLVLLTAIIPGAGHVIQGRPQRGLMFLFFMVLFGWLSLRLMPPEASFIGRHIGAIFIYGVSLLDAYKFSKIKWEIRNHAADR